MGTIERIRQISPYAFIIFAIIFVAFMVLSDNITSLSTSGGESIQTASIAEINGDKIYYKDYEEKVRIRIEQMRNNPQNQNQEVDEKSVRTQIWNEMVDEILLKQAGEKFGIIVTDDEIADILIENPPDFLKQSFTDTAGHFNKEMYLELITNPEQLIYYMGRNPDEIDPAEKERQVNNFRNELVAIGEYLKLQKLNEAMANTITAAYAVTSPSYVKEKYINENSTANINFIYLSPDLIQDSIKVSDSEVQNYYDKHKTVFKVKESRKVKTLNFPFVPSQEDSARVSRRIDIIQESLANATDNKTKDSIFTVKINEYTGTEHDWALIQDINPQVASVIGNVEVGTILGPIQMVDGTYFIRVDGRRKGEQEVVKASHILINFNDNKDSAKAEAIRILGEASRGDFAALAAKYSQDRGSAMQGGDLGYFGKGRMVPEFEKAAFNTKVGSVTGPIESQFGYHIIKVMDKKSDEIKYSEIVLAPSVSGSTKNKIKRDAYAAMKQIEEGENIDSLAAKLQISCDESYELQKNRPFYGSMALTNKIYDAKLDGVIEPMELDNNVIVCQVSEITKPGLAPIEKVREQIVAKVTNIKRIDMLKVKADNMFDMLKNNNSLDNLDNIDTNLLQGLKINSAVINNNGTIEGAPQDFVATTLIFNNLEVGKINKPIRGETGYFIVELKDRNILTEEQAKDAKDMTKEQYSKNLFDVWFSKFKEDSKIVDKRSKYYGEY